jgi:hypothetical protein
VVTNKSKSKQNIKLAFLFWEIIDFQSGALEDVPSKSLRGHINKRACKVHCRFFIIVKLFYRGQGCSPKDVYLGMKMTHIFITLHKKGRELISKPGA